MISDSLLCCSATKTDTQLPFEISAFNKTSLFLSILAQSSQITILTLIIAMAIIIVMEMVMAMERRMVMVVTVSIQVQSM